MAWDGVVRVEWSAREAMPSAELGHGGSKYFGMQLEDCVHLLAAFVLQAAGVHLRKLHAGRPQRLAHRAAAEDPDVVPFVRLEDRGEGLVPVRPAEPHLG